ncbi:4-amino-4-deoxychorismate lyase [Marinicauda salina]|uniref:Probable branched-chain-amino-acid aminotransferase n=1 Tax=Marinicauda salina TaxID=2135793 RepID=A0A2U2BXM1_9PROT|nr:aminotransferase class IV [Marinicauda salina]PWE18761.1 4-amino-4-deoxychorismate lyase [Marinicauda salina]
MSAVWLNGEYGEDLSISPDDRGFLLGDGAFETLHFKDDRLRRWTRHRARLADALETLGIAEPDWEELQAAARGVPRENGLDDAIVRISVSRGPGGPGLDFADDVRPTVLVTARPHPGAPGARDLVTIDAPRRDPRSLSAAFKPLSYGDWVHARRRARERDGDMAVLLSQAGDPACADCANLFWIKDGVVHTPSTETGALAGTTRAALIAAAAEAAVTIREGVFRRSELAEAEAAFVTNATLGVAPVRRLDGRELDRSHDLILECAKLEAGAA